MSFADRMGKYELEFNQAVTAFLNNWANVMARAQESQGALFDPNVYPDLTQLRSEFRFRVIYRPVVDANDFRVSMQEEELLRLKESAQQDALESFNTMMREPLVRLREVVAKLAEVACKSDRTVINKKTGAEEIRPPIFRDSVCENIIEEIALLRDFAEFMPLEVLKVADTVAGTVPTPQELRDDPEKRADVGRQAATLVSVIDSLLED